MIDDAFKKKQLKTFMLCWLAYAIVYLGRVNLAISIPFIQTEFGWTKSQIGIISTVFFWIYGTGQLINGKLGDKISSRKMIFVGLFVAGVTNFFFGLSYSLIAMVIFWGLNGFFQSMLWGPLVKSLANWFPHKQRGKTAVFMSFSMVVGYFLAWMGSGRLGVNIGWRWIFFVPAILIVLYSFVWLKFFRDKPSDVGLPSLDEIDADNNNKVKSSRKLFNILIKDRLWIIVIVCFTHGIIKEGIAIWGPVFFIESWNQPVALITSIIAIIPLFNFMGVGFTGWLNKIFGYKEKYTLALLFFACIIFILVLIKFGSIGLIFAIAMLGVISGCMYGANTILLGIIPMNYSIYNKASSMAGFMDFITYAAAGISSFITGMVIDRFSWDGMLYMWVTVAVIGLVLTLLSFKLTKNPMPQILADKECTDTAEDNN